MKNTIINIHLHEITKQDLTELQKQSLVKIRYKKLDKNFTKKKRIMIFGQISAQIQRHNDEKVAKAPIALDNTMTMENCKF